MKYFCTSETIANYLQKYIIYRKRKIFAGKTGKLADLVPAMLKHKTEKFLLAVSDVNNGDSENILVENKLDYTRGVMYRTVSNDFGPDEAFDYDMLVFFSPQGIESLLKNFPDFKQDNRRRSAPRCGGSYGTGTVDDRSPRLVPYKGQRLKPAQWHRCAFIRKKNFAPS